MDVVVVQAKANQDAIETECTLEIRDDRDRRARPHQHRFLAPFLGQGTLCGGERLHVPVKCDGRRAGMIAEFGGAIAGQPRRDIVAKGLSDLVRLLSLYQAKRYLCGRFRRDHGLRTFTGVTANNAIDVSSWSRGDLLYQQAPFFARGYRKPDRLEKRIRRQVEL